MKDIGYSQNGGRIVEMSEPEYKAFQNLRTAVEGGSGIECFMRPPSQYSFMSDYDFSSVFDVILAFYHTEFKITELQEQLNMMKGSLGHEPFNDSD